MVEADPVLREKHIAHLRESQQAGQKGRACTVPAVTPDVLTGYAPLIESLNGVVKPTVMYLGSIIRMEVPTPSIDDLNNLDSLLDTIQDANSRNAVFHIFWHVKEMALGRTPS